MNAYQELELYFQKYYDLEHLANVMTWDEAVMMPTGGGRARAQAMATLKALQHEKLTATKLTDLIARAKEVKELSDWQITNLHWIEKLQRKATCIPSELIEQQTKATFICTQAWRELRAKNDWQNFKPLLSEVFNVTKEIAVIKAQVFGKSAYDILLDEFAPDINCETIDPIFQTLKEQIPALIREAIALQKNRASQEITGIFPSEQQKALGLELMAAIGFDFNHGRLDISHHPFCGGVPQDVRITTRYNEQAFLSALMAICHETGHALYEQGLPQDWLYQPVGRSLGMAVHESQSLLIEMQACRSRAYLQFLTPLAQKYFPQATGIIEENLYAQVTKVIPSYIRVDADELTYPLHVILRYEIEQQLFSGAITIDDLPDIWDDFMQKYLGLSTKGDFKNGVLQDVHWPSGAFGYFPSYTIGAMIAAQLFAAAKKAQPQLNDGIKTGDFSELVNWLRLNVHQKASSISYQQLLLEATGDQLNPDYYLTHLQERYLLSA